VACCFFLIAAKSGTTVVSIPTSGDAIGVS